MRGDGRVVLKRRDLLIVQNPQSSSVHHSGDSVVASACMAALIMNSLIFIGDLIYNSSSRKKIRFLLKTFFLPFN